MSNRLRSSEGWKEKLTGSRKKMRDSQKCAMLGRNKDKLIKGSKLKLNTRFV